MYRVPFAIRAVKMKDYLFRFYFFNNLKKPLTEQTREIFDPRGIPGWEIGTLPDERWIGMQLRAAKMDAVVWQFAVSMRRVKQVGRTYPSCHVRLLSLSSTVRIRLYTNEWTDFNVSECAALGSDENRMGYYGVFQLGNDRRIKIGSKK